MLISIGITIFGRSEYISNTITSILNNNKYNIEVIVGNDDASTFLTKADLNISDSRLRIVNNTSNLGERLNMKSLLMAARGEYFTWLADDDYYESGLIDELYKVACTKKHRVIYTSYTFSDRTDRSLIIDEYISYNFINLALSRKIKAISIYALYDREFLININPLERLHNGKIALFTEYYLFLASLSDKRVLFISSPAVRVNVNHDSWSVSNNEVDLYYKAGISLSKKLYNLLESNGKNLPNSVKVSIYMAIFNLILNFYTSVSRRSVSFISSIRNSLSYFLLISRLYKNMEVFPGYIWIILSFNHFFRSVKIFKVFFVKK